MLSDELSAFQLESQKTVMCICIYMPVLFLYRTRLRQISLPSCRGQTFSDPNLIHQAKVHYSSITIL